MEQKNVSVWGNGDEDPFFLNKPFRPFQTKYMVCMRFEMEDETVSDILPSYFDVHVDVSESKRINVPDLTKGNP